MKIQADTRGDERGVSAVATSVDDATTSPPIDWAAKSPDGEEISDLAYTIAATPIGDLLLVVTDRGLIRVAFAVQDHDRVLTQLADRAGRPVVRSPRRLGIASRQLGEYFTGRRTEFDVPLDHRLSTGFRRTVLTRLLSVAYGHTASYATIAAASGSPRAVRAVGTACATNPLPVFVPCHRVIRSDGSAGGYVGGVGAKDTLLALETNA